MVLSVLMGVGGCTCPNSAKHVRMEHASFPLWNSPASSASDAADTISFRMLHMTCTGALCIGSASLGWGGVAGSCGLSERK